MTEPVRKSLLNLTVSVGGIAIDQGGGENDFVSITSPQNFDTKTGVHGDVVFYDMPGSVYEVSITLLETAPLNENLQNLYAAQKTSPTSGPTTVTIADKATGERLSGPAMVVKPPDVTKTAEVQNYEWTIHLASREGIQYQTPAPYIP